MTMARRWWGTALAGVIALPVGPVQARAGGLAEQEPGSRPAVVIDVRAPEPRRFALALDELWIASAAAPETVRAEVAPLGLAARGAPGQFLEARLPASTSVDTLREHVRRVRGAVGGAEVFLALYEPGNPRDAAHRALLTCEVALILEPGQTLESVAPFPAGARPLAGLPGAYVVRADDPLEAVALAQDLASRAGVRSAYPLLRRSLESR